MPGQNIIELGYDIEKFHQQTQSITEDLERVYSAILNMEKTKINAGSMGGIGELKSKIAEMEKKIEELTAANLAYVQSQIKVTEVTKQTTTATRDEIVEVSKKIVTNRQLSDQQKETLSNLQKSEEALKKNSKQLEIEANWLKHNKENLDRYNEARAGKVGNTPKGDDLNAKFGRAQTDFDKIKKQNEELAEIVAKNRLEYEKAEQAAAEYASAVAKANSQDSQGGSTGDVVQETIDNQKILLDLYSQNEIVLRQYTAAKKELADQFKAGAITEEDYITTLSSINEAQIATKREQQELTTILRNVDKATDEASGKLNKMRAELVLLQIAYAKMTDEEQGSPLGEETKQRASELANLINTEQQKIGDFTKNIGRYAESLKPAFDAIIEEIKRLKAEREGLETKFQNLNPEQQQGDMGFKLKGQIDETTASIERLDRTFIKGFQTTATYTQQINTLGKEYVDMKESGKYSESFLKELSDVIAKAKNETKKYQDELKNSKTSNFTDSIKILTTALDKAKERLKQLTDAKKLDTEEGKRAQEEVELLTVLVGQQESGFKSLATEIMTTGKQLQILQDAGLQSSEEYKKLNEVWAESKRKLNDMTAAQRLLSSSTPKIDALISAGRGLAGMYAAGAGAANLFAGDNEKVQESIQKLVAVMSILNGLKEVQEFLDKKGAVAQVLFGTATAATTVAVSGEAVAAGAATVATTAFGRALAFIQANPIILALTALAAIVLALTFNLKEQEDQLADTAEEAKNYSETLDNLSKSQTIANDILVKGLKDQKKALEDNLKLKSGNISANEEFKLKQDILNIDVLIANKNKESQKGTLDNLKDQELQVASNNARYMEQQGIITKMQDLQKQGKTTTGKILDQMTTADMSGSRTITIYEKVSDVIEEATKKAEGFLTARDAAQKTVTQLTGVKEEPDEAALAAEKNKLDQQKYNADQWRKIQYANAQIEVGNEIEKNDRIINDEKSSYDERLKAMRDNVEARKRLARAEYAAIDPIDATAKSIGRSTMVDKVSDIDKNQAAEEIRMAEDRQKKLLSLEYERIRLEKEARAGETLEIANNSGQTTEVRLAAYDKYIQMKKELIDAEFNYQKTQQGLNNPEIVAKDKEKQDALLLLQTQAKEKKIQLTQDEIKQIKAIKDQGAEQEKALIKSGYQLQMDKEVNSFNDAKAKLDIAFKSGLISKRKYTEDSLKLQADYSKRMLVI